MRTNTIEPGPAALTQLIAVEQQILGLEQEHETASRALGEALAAKRTGDKTADPGRHALKRSGIESELTDLRLTRTALQATVAVWREGEGERTRQAAKQQVDAVTDEARTLERRLAQQMEAAAVTARELQAVARRWQAARQVAGKLGIPLDVEAPRLGAILFNNATIDRPDQIARWLAPRRTVQAPPTTKLWKPPGVATAQSAPDVLDKLHVKAMA